MFENVVFYVLLIL